MDNTWLEARIAATKSLIEAIETAILSVSTGKVKSYTIDTGQTKNTVTNENLDVVQGVLEAQYSLLAVLEARRYGAAGQGRPGW